MLSATSAPELLLDINTISAEYDSGYPSTYSSSPNFLQLYQGEVYFGVETNQYTGPTGSYADPLVWSPGGLWKTDGTSAGTLRVDDPNPGDDIGLVPREAVVFNNQLYFYADYYDANGSNQPGLWKTDGTDVGTVPVTDIWPGEGSSSPRGFLVFNNELYFYADDGTSGLSLWKTDGTSEGTAAADIHPGGGVVDVEVLGIFNNDLYYTVPLEGATGWELWKTDGTVTGSAFIADINARSIVSPTFFNGELYFYADDGTVVDFRVTPALSKIDHTTGSTVAVNAGSGELRSGHNHQIVVLNNELYFSATDGESGNELWKTNGTTAGTVPVTDINSGSESSFPRELTVFNNELYFGVSVGLPEWQAPLISSELWKTDGTSTGTTQVARPNNIGFTPSVSGLTVFNSALYFVAPAETWVNELWRTDGTAEGTERLTFFALNPYPSQDAALLLGVREPLFPAGDFAVFAGPGSAHGDEPWIIRVVAPEVTPENLAQVIDELPSGTTEVQASATPSNLNDFFTAIAALPANTGDTIDIVLNLTEGDYEGAVIEVPAGYRVVINGDSGEVVFHGASPALTLQSGDLRVKNVTFVNSTDAASIVVNGGSLAVRNSLIRETTGGAQAALEINGGSVDLGTLADPGGNTLEVSGQGGFIRNLTAFQMPAIGNQFLVDGIPLASDILAVPEWMRLVIDPSGGGVSLVGVFSLTVTVNDATWEIGMPFPAFTVSYDGFVHGDTENVLAGEPDFITAATSSSQVGTYSVATSGLTSNKYDIAFVAGTLTVTPAIVEVDLRPASLNVDQNGAISLVIFGSSTFDVSQVSLGSLAFAGVSIDVFSHTLVDADQDGKLDLLVHFKSSDALKIALTEMYSDLLAQDYEDDGDYSTKQVALVALDGAFGEYDQEFHGSDATSLFLAGKSLKTLLEHLEISA